MAGWRNVRVFLSSTFRDMHAERDYLIKFTFPALRERLLPHRVELYDIDLRWGITEDEARNQKVISLCLEQVDECRPFFLAFLGHRYGWVPDKIDEETRHRFPFVDRFPGVSVTELELRHGALAEVNSGQTLVLLRQQEALETIPAPTRGRDFTESDPQVQAKLEKLKQDLQAGPFPVQPYSASWDKQAYDRVNRTRGKLEGLDEFGRSVETWLWEAIRTELNLPDAPAAVDPLEAEAYLHERFLELRTRIYIGRDPLYQQLRSFALADGEIPLLLTGESGTGKSAALARFVRDFRKERPDLFVLAHFVGASPGTTALPTILKRLIDELQRRFHLTLPEAKNPEEILRNFALAITSLPAESRVLLVFDALNQLDADRRADSLAWLPETLPANVRILCSSATGPQQAPRVLTAFGERDFVPVPLQPLTEQERRSLVRAVPKLVAKTLDDQQIAALLANPATQNPLYLMVALEELRGYGSFENLNALINRLPRDGDALTRLFQQVFQRLEKEFGQTLVQRTLTLLACARRGLSGPELTELTWDLGETAEVYPLLRQLEPYLHRRDGRYDFYHMSIRRAVETLYLQWAAEEDQNDPWLRWNADREQPAADPSEPETSARDRLIEHFQQEPLSARSLDELPWQLAQLRSWQALFDLLGDLEFFAAAYRANKFEVREAWSLVKTLGRFEPIEAYREVLADPARQDGNALWRLALYLEDSGEGAAVLPLWSHFIERFRASGEEELLQGCLGNQAVILYFQCDLAGATALLKENEAICRRLSNHAGLAKSLGNQALILQAQRDLAGAMALLKENEAIFRRLNDPDGVARSLGNQALIFQAQGDLAGAMALRKAEEAICRRLNDPDGLAHSLGNQALILRAQADLTGAMALHKKEEAICERLNSPNGLASSLGNQSLILQAQGDLAGAMDLLKKQEAICRRTNNPDGLQASLGNQAWILQAQRDLAGAMPLLKENEAICRRLKTPDELAVGLGNQALILQAQGDLAGAMALHKEAEAIFRRLNNPNGLSISLVNQAALLAFGLSQPGEGLPLAEEALRLATEHGLLAPAKQIEPVVQRIRDQLR